MRAITLVFPAVLLIALTGCEGTTEGGKDWVKIPAGGPRGAASLEDANGRATAWCRKQGFARAASDDDGDARFYRFTCKN